MAHVYLENKFDLNDLAEQIVHNYGLASTMTYIDLVDFFARIDDLIGDWDLTREIEARFSRELKKLEGIDDK